jgi:parallel beta-helix repeat protein
MNKKFAVILAALCLSSIVLVFSTEGKAQQPPYRSDLPPSLHILADGSVDPPTASVSRAGDVYTLTGDVGVSIIVDKNNVTIDGAGYKLWGNFSAGVSLNEKSGVTVKNLVVKEATYAFHMYKASDNTFVGNTIANCSKAFYFWLSWRNNITGNTVIGAGEAFDFVDWSEQNIIKANSIQNCGIGTDLSEPSNVFSDNIVTGSFDVGLLLSSDSNVFRNNTLSNNRLDFAVSSFNNDVDQSNTINGKPIVFWIGHHDETVPSNAAYVVLVNCSNIQVQNLDVESVATVSTFNSILTGNRITRFQSNIQPVNPPDMSYPVQRVSPSYGIQLIHSSNNVVSGNSVWGKDYGLELANSRGNRVVGNSITANSYYGTMLTYSNDNTFEGNNISGNGFVSGDVTRGDAFGVSITDSSGNFFVGNNITGNNYWGIRVLGNQHDNLIYNNNFVDNQVRDGGLQVSMMGVYPSGLPNTSFWDNGTRGNYWSDYKTRYPNASEVAGSGLGDTPFYINENNQDNHPLMAPYDISAYEPTSPPPQSPAPSTTSQPSETPPVSPLTSPTGSLKPVAGLNMPWEIVLAVTAVAVAAVIVTVYVKKNHK